MADLRMEERREEHEGSSVLNHLESSQVYICGPCAMASSVIAQRLINNKIPSNKTPQQQHCPTNKTSSVSSRIPIKTSSSSSRIPIKTSSASSRIPIKTTSSSFLNPDPKP
ncbi:hypothetical protein PGTUg99_032207 [Puccinia graminis f. sp. tritici]|uniref:Uncharacterized protein n=1 Tax=Puccinia graminis f. sp. tritici TaxID=56615 RepID=A0A5B0LTY1_PUCGR|nr:hypothetical protein PGTUg99_032207 [Puccinia graminis f. sp. tritici]